jgi:hypothetical protein
MTRLLVEGLRHRTIEVREAATELGTAHRDGTDIGSRAIGCGVHPAVAGRRVQRQALRRRVGREAEPHRVARRNAQGQARSLRLQQPLGLQALAQVQPLPAQVLFDRHRVRPA